MAKIPLDNVYFMCKSSEFLTFIAFYCNKSNEVLNFIHCLYFVSHNEYILQFAWDDKSQKKQNLTE